MINPEIHGSLRIDALRRLSAEITRNATSADLSDLWPGEGGGITGDVTSGRGRGLPLSYQWAEERRLPAGELPVGGGEIFPAGELPVGGELPT